MSKIIVTENSIYLVLGVSIMVAIIGVGTAWLVTNYNFTGKNLFWGTLGCAPPKNIFFDWLCIILNLNLSSSVLRYNVPPSELEISLASAYIFSNKRSIFFSFDKEIPISINFCRFSGFNDELFTIKAN